LHALDFSSWGADGINNPFRTKLGAADPRRRAADDHRDQRHAMGAARRWVFCRLRFRSRVGLYSAQTP
jgi:hypothetical protein